MKKSVKNTIKSKKPKNRRSARKYPALDPKVNLPSRYDLIDYDYLHKLSKEEKEWLNKFTEEYTNASFSKNNKENIQKKKSQRKDSYDRNNSRNRCVLNRQKVEKKIRSLDTVKGKGQSLEDSMILNIELKDNGYLNETGEIIKYIKNGKILRKD